MTDGTLAALLEFADEGFVVFDRARRCARIGRRLVEIFGVDRDALHGAPEATVLAQLAGCCVEPVVFAEAMANAHRETQMLELELERPKLRTILLHTHLTEDGGWLGVARDVTRERSAERRAHQLLARLEQITSTDALTQLPNRRRFSEELDREHGRASRAWDSYAVLRIDVDGLAAINAELGQPRGDEVLEQVAERLQAGRREYDLLARWEGDEFVLLVPGADATGTQVIAQRMAENVCAEPLEIGVMRTVTVTIGAAVWVPPSGESGLDVLARAGAALATAQARGDHQLELV